MHTDNCAAQFKNRYLMWYYAYWLQVTLGATVEIRVMHNEPGHTKFSPDRGFAIIRRALKKHEVITPLQLKQVVIDSGKSNTAT
jgi:hypothetical protein